MWSWSKRGKGTGGVMSRLARDVRGNVMMLMGAALIPLCGMVGGGIDISRMYILKTRLQHACDAGSLAGRRTMGGGTWAFNNNYARSEAEEFFDGNFEYDKTTKNGMFGSSNVSRSFAENAGKVTGTASAKIPMTLMRIFGKVDDTITVSCSTEMRLPNTDIMFVLDTTGSMNDAADSTGVKKIDALKTSVKCFYEIVARLDTDALCATGTPSGGTGDQVQVRFGFVPYATNVNVGRLLKPEWFANSWQYQTRKVDSYTWSDWTLESYYQAGRYDTCNPAKPNTPKQEYRVQGPTRTYDGNTYSVYYCIYETRKADQANWLYNQLPVDVSLLKDGNNWRSSFQWPIGANGANRTITWDGCIEERKTVSQTSYSPIPSGAKDLNIDLIPTSSDTTTQWGPALNQLIYARQRKTSWSQLNDAQIVTTDDYYNNVPYYCPTEARKLQEWPDATRFDDYVDSLQPSGNTYHDIGLLWGARLASPNGIFGSENQATSQGGEIERHIIFMTDGDAVSQPCDYTAYGFLFFDKRTSTDVGSAANCANNNGGRQVLNDQIDKRTEALCAAIKNHTYNKRQSFTLWVIAFGTLDATTEKRLSDCATAGRYFKATSAAQLQTTFKSIADQISMLRLTQ